MTPGPADTLFTKASWPSLGLMPARKRVEGAWLIALAGLHAVPVMIIAVAIYSVHSIYL